jgi:hypothetical protein
MKKFQVQNFKKFQKYSLQYMKPLEFLSTHHEKVPQSKEDSLSENSSDEEPVVENRNKWNDNSLLKEIIKDTIEFDENEKDQLIEILQKNSMKTLEHWKLLSVEAKEKDGYPRGLRSVLDKVAGK